ncbi:MAG: hypothetical protein K1X57_06480 [Gemmataceae bacterium]|nr:hypothetical protein [Gemmataceae bacterium]
MTRDSFEALLNDEPAPVREAARWAAAASGRRRLRLLEGLVELVGPDLPAFVARLLAADADQAAILGLRLVGLQPATLKSLQKPVRGLVRRRDLPLSARLAATSGLLGVLDHEGQAARLLIRAFAAGLGRRGTARLDELIGKLKGAGPALRAELADREKMRCPRCGATRRRRDMTRHLWQRHQLVLDGRRALSPAQAIDQSLPDGEPEAALTEFHQKLLASGLRDAEAEEHLRGLAAERHEWFCTSCFRMTPRTDPPLPRPAELAAGRLATDNARVTLIEKADRTWVRVERPGSVETLPATGDSIWPHWLRRASAGCALGAIPAAMFLPTGWHVLSAAALLGESLVLDRWAELLGRDSGDPIDRVVDEAWKHLVPKLEAGTELARVALASIGRGNTDRRETALAEAIRAAESAVQIGAVGGAIAGTLWALEFSDAVGDPVPPAAYRLSRVWEGELPLTAADAFAQWLNADPATMTRLSVLACERAFLAGLGVWDLAEIGRVFPALGRLVVAENVDGLARRRLVWFDRNDKPWRSVGPAASVFELARRADFEADSGDAILYCPLPGGESLTLGARGLVFRGAVLRGVPGEATARPREEWRGGGWDMLLGPHRFRFQDDPTPLVGRLLAWAHWWFEVYLPRVDAALKYRSTGRLAQLLRPHRPTCPACGVR